MRKCARNRMICATAIKGTKLLRFTLHWIPQPSCLVIYFACVITFLCTRCPDVGILFLSSKLVYFSAVAFRWSALRRGTENHSCLPFFSSLNSQFAAGFGFAVERPGDGCRPTHFT